MAVLQDFKCPNCHGSINFDGGSQMMKCPFCDTEYEAEELVSYNQDPKQGEGDMQWEAPAGQNWTEDEQTGLRSYICTCCAGEIIADATTGATACPYCDSPVVISEQFAGVLKPDLVIPFKLDKKAAKEALKKHYSGKRLLPKVFKDENHIDEVKGVYVPFWLFEADAKAYVRYRATRVRHWSSSDYNYTETRYYSVIRGGNLGFDWVPVDGSSKMADALMESIEPFDISAAVDFNTAYLAGYLADKYDVNAQQSEERANGRIRNTTEAAFASTVVGFSSVTPVATNIQLQNGKAKYALYPVWLLNTTWNGKKYTFAMNGQTGKVAGDLPLDKGAYHKWLWSLTGVIGAAVFGLSYLIWML